jgi:hypothetical protein
VVRILIIRTKYGRHGEKLGLSGAVTPALALEETQTV